MRHGTLSKRGGEQLGWPSGTRVKYDLYPDSSEGECAKNIYLESDGVRIGGTLEIGPDGIIDSSQAINDCHCPHCNNDKVSSTEKSCWKCGGKL